MLRALLAHAAAGGDARFEASTGGDDGLHAALRTLPSVEKTQSYTCEGPLTDAAVALFAVHLPDALRVESGMRLRIDATDHAYDEKQEERPVGVWCDPDAKDALQGEPMRAWWEPALERLALPAPRDRRRVSRKTRAWLYRGWDSVGARITILVGIPTASRLVEFNRSSALVSIVLLTTLPLTIDEALKLWYERS